MMVTSSGAQLSQSATFRSAPPIAAIELAPPVTHVDPAALARLAVSPPLRYGAWSSSERGSFRRGVDAAQRRIQGIGAFGGLKVGAHGALMGGVELERTLLAKSSIALLNAFTNAPFALIDTFAPQLLGTALRIEGATARAFGRWDAGLTARYAAVEAASAHTARMRTEQASALELLVGGGRHFRDRYRVAASARWRDGNETVRIIPNPFGGIAYVFVGFEDQLPLSYHLSPIYRRSATGALDASFLASAGGPRRGVEVLTQRLQQHDNQHTQRIANAPRDRWSSTGWAGTLSAHLASRDTSRRLSVRASLCTADDESRRHDLSVAVHRASRSEATFGIRAETPLPQLAGVRWTFGVDARMERATHDDYLTRTRWTRTANGWMGSARAEWRFGRGQSLALLGALGAVTPTSVLPTPSMVGPVFRRWLYDAFAVEGTPTVTSRGAVDAGWKLQSGDVISLLVDGMLTKPRNATLPLVPTGSRSVVTVAVRWEPK
jgi:hypothetical protein